MDSKQVADWLSSLGTSDVYPVQATIGKNVYIGAHYIQNTCRRLYLLGKKPKQRLAKTVYVVGDDLWYVISEYDVVHPGDARFHPFGRNFILQLNTGTDDFKEYQKVPMTLTNQGD